MSLSAYFQCSCHPRAVHSFPTRRSSDLDAVMLGGREVASERADRHHEEDRDRKSTRLNSSHLGISYAVFCLKKKIHANSWMNETFQTSLKELESRPELAQSCTNCHSPVV